MELKLSVFFFFFFLVLFVVKHNSQVVTLIVSQVPIPAGAVLFTAILPLLARVVLLALVGTHRWKTRTHYHYCTSQHCGTPDPCTYTPLGDETRHHHHHPHYHHCTSQHCGTPDPYRLHTATSRDRRTSSS